MDGKTTKDDIIQALKQVSICVRLGLGLGGRNALGGHEEVKIRCEPT